MESQELTDLRTFNVGDKPDGIKTELEACPICQKPGLCLIWHDKSRQGYAHIVDIKNRRVIEGCLLDSGGGSA